MKAAEATPEQASVLEKVFQQEAAEAKADGTKTRPCPECGIPNSINRITCEVCGLRMDAYKQSEKRGGNMEKLKKDLFESNKRLKAARAVEDPKLESKCYNGETWEGNDMNKVSISELSRRTGLSVSFISRLIRGKRKPSMNTIIKLSVATGMNEDKVLRWPGWRKSGRRKP